MKLLLLRFILLCLLPQQPGSGTLVVDVRTGGRPLAGANVSAGMQHAKTNEQGRAELSLPAGSYQVLVSAEGFHDEKFEARIGSGEQARFEVECTAQAAGNEEIVVSAVRTERRLEDQPVRVEVVDREDIEEKALMTPGSVAMLLGETTGLRVQTTSPSLGSANVRIQGLRGHYSQLLSDGLPIYGVQGDSLSLLQIPPLDLGQVEVIKGAASALYGPSALGGIINLVSQRPMARRRELLVNQSTRASTDLAFWATEPPHRNWALTLLGGLHGQSRQDIDGDGWADLPKFIRGTFRPRVFWDDGRGHTAFATLGVMAEDRRGGTMAGANAPDGSPFTEQVNSRRVDGGTVVRLALSKNRIASIRGSISHRGETRIFGDVTERGGQTTWQGEASLLGTAGRHTWLIGAAVQQDRYVAQDLPAFDYSFTTPGLFAQDEIDISRKLTLGLSGRIDRHSQYGTFASPRISLLFKPAPAWRARVSAGTGFFAPTPFIEETEETGLSRLRPLHDLVAERARSASLDGSWSRGPAEFVATLFGSIVRAPLQRRFDSDRTQELVNAQGPVRTWGTELLVRCRLHNLLVMGTHNYTRSREDDPERLQRRDVPLTPRHYIGLNAIWESKRWVRLGLEAYYIGRQPLEENPYRTVARGYLLWGFLVQRPIGKFILFLNAENLGNIRQTRYDPLVRQEQAPDGRWTVDSWAPLDGRAINGGIRFRF